MKSICRGLSYAVSCKLDTFVPIEVMYGDFSWNDIIKSQGLTRSQCEYSNTSSQKPS